MDMYSRTELLIGTEGIDRLKKSKVAVIGLGGVGSYVVEALARTGLGTLFICDNDIICESNMNRQIMATKRTLGMKKTDALKERIIEINPEAIVEAKFDFYSEKNATSFDFSGIDYIVDAIDTVAAKLSLISEAKRMGIPIISCMGTGNKLDPTKFEVADINKTSVCPLARAVRKGLKKLGIKNLKVVYSKEEPYYRADVESVEVSKQKRDKSTYIPGSIAFVPSVAGLIIAGEVIKDLLGNNV